MLQVVGVFFGLDEHIFDMDFHGLAYQQLKYLGYQPSISRSSVFQAKKSLHCNSIIRVV